MSQEDERELETLLEFVHRQRGIDFASYKRSTLRRRIAKRMHALGVETHGEYLDYLQASPDEFEPLLEALFINVTAFFRDPEAWDVVREEVIPDILRAAGDDPVRVWCAGVASGEEVYTVAMLLAAAMGEDRFVTHAKIFATDLDDDALAHARAATYAAEVAEAVPPDLRERFFEPAGDQLQFRSDLRRVIIFGRHDLLEDAPISRVHLLVCRNTIMYFNREAQGRILSRFHFALRPEGYLFLGKAEMLLTRRNLFTPMGNAARLFRKVSDLSFRDRLTVMSQVGMDDDHQSVLGEVQLRELAFDSSPQPELVIDGQGRLALANRAARMTFRIGRADIGQPFQDLEISYKPVELRSPSEEARRKREVVDIEGVAWRGDTGTDQRFDVRLEPLLGDGKAVAVKVIFLDVTRHHELAAALAQSRKDLEVAYEELQSTNEELETTNEELQSTVEELETTNEELQSTNEELETMNEELQSTNVEVETVNEELRERTDEVERVGLYLGSILNSLPDAVVVLDRDLVVRIWNRRAEELWGLRAPEIDGRAFLDLDIGLPVKEMEAVLASCLRGEEPGDGASLDGHDRRGRKANHHVRCIPLRNTDGDVGGVIAMVKARIGDG